MAISGTATYGEDYTTTPDGSGSSFDVNVLANDASATITFSPIDDEDVEDDETVIFTITTDAEGLDLGAKTTLTVTLASDDVDDTPVLVSVERSTGTMYEVSTSDGTLTKIMDLTYDGNAISEIRSFVYDESTNKGFLGTSGNSDGYFYSLDMSSGIATLLNDNSNDFNIGEVTWDGIADLLIDGDHVMSSIYMQVKTDNGDIFSNGLAWFNKTTGVLDSYLFPSYENDDDNICCGGALTYNGSDGVYYGSNKGKIYSMNTTSGLGNNPITLSTDDASPFISDIASFDLSYVHVQDFAVHKDGNAYAIVLYSIEDNSKNFLVSLDFSNGKITYIRSFETKNDNHGLTFVPAYVLE